MTEPPPCCTNKWRHSPFVQTDNNLSQILKSLFFKGRLPFLLPTTCAVSPNHLRTHFVAHNFSSFNKHLVGAKILLHAYQFVFSLAFLYRWQETLRVSILTGTYKKYSCSIWGLSIRGHVQSCSNINETRIPVTLQCKRKNDSQAWRTTA